MGKSPKLGNLVVFSVIIAVFSALAITFFILPSKKTTPKSFEEKQSDYVYYEVRNGQKVPVGSSNGEIINEPKIDTPQTPPDTKPQPLPDTEQVKPPSIPTDNNLSAGQTKRTLTCTYRGQYYAMDVYLENSLDYKHPTQLISEADYHSKILNTKPEDNSIKDIAKNLKNLARTHGLSDDQTVDLLATFVQSMPYSHVFGPAKFPYQTLLAGKGDCDDKSLLAYNILKELGYGVALFSFPDFHMAVGIACPVVNSLNSSGFAFMEVAGPGLSSIGQIPKMVVGRQYELLLPHPGKKYRSFSTNA